MSQADQQDSLAQPLRLIRIVIMALVSGSLIMAGVAFFYQQNQNVPVPDQPLLSYIAVAHGMILMGVLFALPGMMMATARKALAKEFKQPATGKPPSELEATLTQRLAALFNTRTIIQGALLEGAAMFLLVAYMVEGTIWTLFLALAFVAGLAFLFPSRAGMEAWIEEQKLLVEQEGF